ncbi:phage tail fiber protein, partial [Providencia sp.]|uniref:phage tail fiber protein n=1 Tax=Providencia sp. TaxID=589 RepID=UPI003F9705AB
NTGTVTATANSTKLIGTGTKWLNNINRVSVEQAIQIQIGATVHNNSIQSIQSDTELTLNFPLPIAAAAAKYVILTTMVHSVSDAMNKIVSMNGSNVQFSDILTRWMTEQGIITVTLPDQTTQQLRTTKEMDKQLDGKFDKAGGTISGELTLTGKLKTLGGELVAQKQGTTASVVLNISNTNIPQLSAKKDDANWTNHNVPDKSGTLMQVGDFGWGKSSSYYAPTNKIADYRINSISYAEGSKGDSFLGVNNHLLNIFGFTSSSYGYQVGFVAGQEKVGFRAIINNVVKSWQEFYTTANTTKDSNGNLKAASPIIKVFADHIELNDESEGVELEKLSTGRYKLKGTLGMNSDASWGGYHGGLVIPNGINNLPLVWADFKVEADGDIIIETHYRKYADLPPPVVLNRLITYPEFMDENGNELDSYTPCDIPNGHWIDVRVNMPSDSLYNQKQAEAQRLAEIEAERLAKEEAENAGM